MTKRVAMFAFAAIFVLAAAVPSAAAAAGYQQTNAVAAKKCKKGKKSAAAAKKKGCKKKKATTPVAPIIPVTPVATPTIPTAPTLRATLTWNTTADLDLYIWAPDGTLGAAFDSPNPIPSSSFSADDTDGFGPETFTDLLSPSTRQFTYGICVADDDGLDGTVATLVYKRADGSTATAPPTPAGSLDDDGDGLFLIPTGGYDPSGDPPFC